jgi:GrpB-like predicted nucleotidyltransferase (UPF0157 family)
MSDIIIINEYDDEWPLLFQDLGQKLRSSLGDVALRIDHIGSTELPGNTNDLDDYVQGI